MKLDELLRAVDGARTGLVNLEKLSDEELLQLHKEFDRLGPSQEKLTAAPARASTRLAGMSRS